MNWQALMGQWTFAEDIIFHGQTFTRVDAEGKNYLGPGIGLAMSDAKFSTGKITAEIEFTNIGYLSSCELAGTSLEPVKNGTTMNR